MTLRDRLVLTGVIVLAVLGGAWVLVVSPARKQAREAGAQVASAKAALASAESKLDAARQAQASYSAAYASIVSVGKAVPTSQEVPTLIYQLTQVARQQNVDFQGITVGAGGSSSSSAAPVSSTGFAQLPFTFAFSGSYFKLEQLLRKLDDLATLTPAGTLQVTGRLLTVQSVRLSPDTETGRTGLLSASVSATAYQLPAEPLTSASSTAGAVSAASAGGASSATTAAVVGVR